VAKYRRKSKDAERVGQMDVPMDLDIQSSTMAMTKTSVVYSDLHDRIMSGEFEPGTRLVIRRIAERHKVSDIPVREALRLLEKDNLIRYLPFGSAFVREAGDEEIYEVFFIRGLLEGAATQLCVNFVTEMTLRKLDQLCENMERHARENDVVAYSSFNREFHRTIFRALPFTKLTKQIEELWQSYGWLQLTFRFKPGRMMESNTEHRQIVRALRERSMAAAGRAAFLHKQSARRSFIEARRRGGNKLSTARDESMIEGIELLCELWQESQWSHGKKAPRQSGPDSIALVTAASAQLTRRSGTRNANGTVKRRQPGKTKKRTAKAKK
jgi:DNA-binding GntR family transcriptional regulator